MTKLAMHSCAEQVSAAALAAGREIVAIRFGF